MTVSGALRKALEVHAVMVTASPHQNTHKTYRGNWTPIARREDAQKAVCWSCGETGHFYSSCDGYPHQKSDVNSQRDVRE
jgi:hypothetical protein